MSDPRIAEEARKPSRPKSLRVMVYPALLVTQLILCLGLALWTVQWGLAGLHAYPARFVLDSWKQTDTRKKTRYTPKKETWLAAMEALAKARQLAPGNADILMILGRMHHHNALTHPSWSDKAKFHRRQAVISYQQALQRRPAWSYAWLLLAQVRVQSGASTKEAIADLMRAITLAPWSEDVQKTSVQLGFALWPLLNEPQRDKIHALMKNAFPRYGDVILKQAVRYKQLKRIQPFLEKNPQWQTILDKLLSKIR